MEIVKHVKVKNITFAANNPKILDRIKRLNIFYRKHGFCIRLLKDTVNEVHSVASVLNLHYRISIQDINNGNTEDDGNFFFYPTHKIYAFDGSKEELIGYRVSCIQLTVGIEGKQFKKISLNFKLEDLKTGDWLDDKTLIGFKTHKRKADIINVMKLLLDTEIKKAILLPSVIGWVTLRNNLFYLPFSNGMKGSIYFDTNNTQQNFKYQILEDIDDRDAYKKMQELLNITDRQTAIQLLSFTVISTMQTLIQSKNNEFPKFMVCLHGSKNGEKEALSNLFCNIYNRSKYIYGLDSSHANNKLTTKLKVKIEDVRDVVFISKIKTREDLKPHEKLLESNCQCGLLLLNNKAIKHDSVIDINISKSLDKNIIDYHKDSPHLFTTWFDSFINYTEKMLKNRKWGLGVKGNIDKLYNKCKDRIEEKSLNYHPIKLNHYSGLLVGYMMFLRHGVLLNEISEKEYDNLLNEAVSHFRELSEIKMDEDNENPDEIVTQSPKEAALIFLFAVDSIVKDEELNPINITKPMPIWGWIGNENGEYVLQLKSLDLFNEVKKFTIENKINFKTQSTSIYEFLKTEKILIVDDEERYGIRKKKTRGKFYNNFHIPNMKKCLEDNGYKLKLLKDK